MYFPNPLNPGQVDFFNQQGYFHLPAAVPPALLRRLQELFETQMQDNSNTEKTINNINGIEYITSLEKICSKGNLAVLELLGSPQVLELAQQLCGPDFFMIQEFSVIKHLGDSTPVLWHQDMLHERTGRCFTMGIYLDEAGENDGALRVIPGSHSSGKDICTLQKEPSLEVPMQPGDILIHDMMLAHSSGIMQLRQLRRVIYFEFLSVQQTLHENIYTPALVQNRLQLLQLAMYHYRKLHPDEPQFEYRFTPSPPLAPVTDFEMQLRAANALNVQARPSAYCFEFV